MNNERINSFPFNPTEFPFNIEISGISNCDEEYTVYREKSYCYILEYIYEGSGTLICNGREYKVGKGCCLRAAITVIIPIRHGIKYGST